MKKFLFSLATVVAMATGGFLGYSSADSDSKLSSIMLANIEALANNEDSEHDSLSGSPCYNGGHFDIEYPEAVVCGNPCTRQNYDPGFWASRSYCP